MFDAWTIESMHIPNLIGYDAYHGLVQLEFFPLAKEILHLRLLVQVSSRHVETFYSDDQGWSVSPSSNAPKLYVCTIEFGAENPPTDNNPEPWIRDGMGENESWRRGMSLVLLSK